jgi:hypothetical protein
MLRTVATDDNPGQDERLEEEDAMDLLCVCGARMPYLFDALDCLTCGRACCPDCAVLIESAWYCARCAASWPEVGHPAAVGGGRLA